MKIEDIGKFIDGVISFYEKYPVGGIKHLIGKDYSKVKKLISYSPVVKNTSLTITSYIEQQHLLDALRRFLSERYLKEVI